MLRDRSVRDKGVRVLFALASLMVVVAGLRAASDILVPFLVAVFVAMLSLPLLNWLQSRRVPPPLAVGLTVLAVVGVLTSAAVVVGTSLRAFTREVPRYLVSLELVINDLAGRLGNSGIRIPGDITSEIFDPQQVAGIVTGTLRGAASLFSSTLLVLLAVVFILSEAAGFRVKLEAAFGQRQMLVRVATMRIEIQRFLAIKTAISVATGAILAAAMALVGIEFALLWGVLAFVLNYIPWLGSILASFPPMLVALVQFGPGRALAVGLIFLAVNMIFGNFLEPHLMGRRLNLSTLVVFFSLVFWGWVWGPMGMLLSVPLTMVVKIMLENTHDLRWLAVLIDAAPREAPTLEPETPPTAAAAPPERL